MQFITLMDNIFLVQSRGVGCPVWWAPEFLQLMCWSADLQLVLGWSEAKCEVIWVRTRHGSWRDKVNFPHKWTSRLGERIEQEEWSREHDRHHVQWCTYCTNLFWRKAIWAVHLLVDLLSCPHLRSWAMDSDRNNTIVDASSSKLFLKNVWGKRLFLLACLGTPQYPLRRDREGDGGEGVLGSFALMQPWPR